MFVWFYCLNWPINFHLWSATFSQSPELEAEKRLKESREIYKKRFGGDFDVVDPRIMGKLKRQNIKWIGSDLKIHEALDS